MLNQRLMGWSLKESSKFVVVKSTIMWKVCTNIYKLTKQKLCLKLLVHSCEEKCSNTLISAVVNGDSGFIHSQFQYSGRQYEPAGVPRCGLHISSIVVFMCVSDSPILATSGWLVRLLIWTVCRSPSC